MPSGKYIHWKNSLGSYFIFFPYTKLSPSTQKQTVCGGDGIKLKLFFSLLHSIHEWIKLKAFPVGMAVVIMWEKAHLTPIANSNSQVKMLPIKLIFIVFLYFLPLLFALFSVWHYKSLFFCEKSKRLSCGLDALLCQYEGIFILKWLKFLAMLQH